MRDAQRFAPVGGEGDFVTEFGQDRFEPETDDRLVIGNKNF